MDNNLPAAAFGHFIMKVSDINISYQFYTDMGLRPRGIFPDMAIIELIDRDAGAKGLTLAFRDNGLESTGSKLAAQLRDDAKGAPVVASLLNLQNVLGNLLQALGNGPAVLGPRLQSTQDQKVQGSLEKVELGRLAHDVECLHQDDPFVVECQQ